MTVGKNAKETSSARTKRITQRFPPGWNEERVRAVIAHYDNLTDEERAREIEEAVEISDETLISVPTDLVPEVRKLRSLVKIT